MTESDGEIEYLEEDAEIVQQCVQELGKSTAKKLGPASKTAEKRPVSLQNTSNSKKKRWNEKTEERDSDYDPNNDVVVSPPSPPPSPLRKKRQPPVRKIRSNPGTSSNSTTYISNISNTKPQTAKQRSYYAPISSRQSLLNRKNFNIRIPDYDDPLCLPVRAIKSTESDLKRLDNWNKVCLEHMKHSDVILKPERGSTRGSVRTAVFKNVVNKQSGNIETTIWSKTSVENSDGDKKSEIFQCVLPRYKEKKVLNNFILGTKKLKNTRTIDQVILNKENNKGSEVLVVYKPKESLSAVYGLIDQRKNQEDDSLTQSNDNSKMYLKELTSTKICAECYQVSWRGVTKTKKRSLHCPICDCIYASIYNLLSHVKTHSAVDVNKHKESISKVLSEIVGYHYKCRVCCKKFGTIKALRRHVKHHQSREQFRCEICNKFVN